MLVLPSLVLAEGPLENRINALEKTLSEGFFNRVELSGVVEVEAGYASDYDDFKQSDVDLTNVELGLDVTLTDFVSGFVMMKWDEDGDEGGVHPDSVGCTFKIMPVGKLYPPFRKSLI